jgi:hypothetical protein
MLKDRLRYELRLLSKAVWLTPVLVVLGMILILSLVSHGASLTTVARALGASLEMLLPLAAGMVVATVGTSDRAIELQLTMPRRYHRTASLRFCCILLWSALISVVTAWILCASNHWRLPVQIAEWSEPWRFVVWQLTWLSSTLWLVALGLVCSLLLRSRVASGALVCGIAIAEVVLHGSINSNSLLHPIYLFPLTFTPEANYWLANRIELLGTAVVLLGLAWYLLHLPELLLSSAPGEE